MGDIVELYERTREAAALPAFDEMAFYAGSPTADVLVVEEAPRWTAGDATTALAAAVERHRSGAWDRDRLATFLREHPFADDLPDFDDFEWERERYYRTYVDRVLDFLEDPRADVGFTHVSKRPLDGDLDAALDDGEYEYGPALAVQLQYVDPVVVVCNRSSVAQVVPELLGLVPPGERPELPTRIAVELADRVFALVFTAPAHAAMDRFSRQRLADEIERIHAAA